MRIVPRDMCSHGSISRLNKLEEGTLERTTSISNFNSDGPLPRYLFRNNPADQFETICFSHA